MNARGAEVLIDAAMRGVTQIRGAYKTKKGVCAVGALAEAAGIRVRGGICGDINRLYRTYEFVSGRGLDHLSCPECGCPYGLEDSLITHLNDIHRWDFLKIARTLGPGEAS